MKIKLCYIIEQLAQGGAEKQLYELVRHLDCKMFQPMIINLDWTSLHPGFSASGIPVEGLNYRGRKDLVKIIQIKQLLKTYNPQIVHCILTSANFYGLMAAILASVPVKIISERSVGNSFRRFSKFIYWKVCGQADVIVTNSRMSKEYLSKRLKVSEEEIVYIPNGCDVNNTERFSMPDDERQALGLKRCEYVVGTVSHFTREKNIECLIKAAKHLLKEQKNLKFMIIGDGPLRKQVEEYIAKVNLEDRFILTGHLADAFSMMRVFDCFVLPSRIEGMPNALMEAMSLGLPCVASKVGGVPELITDYETGLMFESDNDLELAEKIREIGQAKVMARHIGQNARRRIRQNFSIERMVDRYQRLYFKCVNQETAPKKGK